MTGNESEKEMAFVSRLTADPGWLVSCGLITLVGFFLRFYWLGLKPFHHDEGVNGWFLTRLIDQGLYQYDPANYHGPTLYYISLAFSSVFGNEKLPLRWSMAIWGLLIVVLTFFLRRYIGRIGSLFAALFLALSPGMVYISRYFIHEILFVFLALGVVLAVVLFLERRSAGPFAVAWTALLLLIGFSPTVLRFASFLAEEGTTAILIYRILILAVVAVPIFFVIRMLLAWDNGRHIYLLLASACVSLMFATKETAFITLGTMLIAIGCVWLWLRIHNIESLSRSRSKRVILVNIIPIIAMIIFIKPIWDALNWLFNELFDPPGAVGGGVIASLIILLLFGSLVAWFFYIYRYRNGDETEEAGDAHLSFSTFRNAFPANIDAVLAALVVVTVFIYLWVLFFTSFFTYSEGVQKSIEAYAIWTKTGTKDHTQSGFWGYLVWGMRIEAPIFILSVLGTLMAFLKGKDRFAMFTGLWALGLFIAYSLIPYKTPWLMLSFILPMSIIAGYAVNELASLRHQAGKAAAGILAIAASVVLAAQTYDLNFVRYDDDRMPYVYAHTRRDFMEMVAEIERFAEASGEGKEATIEIISPDYWPLVWYMRDYKKALFHGQPIDTTTSEMIVAKKGAQDIEVIRRFAANYLYVGSYTLRPGVDLVLLVRRDLAGPDGKELYRIGLAR